MRKNFLTLYLMVIIGGICFAPAFGTAQDFYSRGMAAYNQMQYREALPDLIQAKNQYKANGLNDQVMVILMYIGAAYNFLGDYNEALAQFTEGYNLAKDMPYHEYTNYYLNNLGNANLQLGNMIRAEDYFLQSVQFAKKTGLTILEASSLVGLSGVYLRIGDIPRSVENVNEALKTSEQLGLPDSILMAKTQLGVIYSTQHQYEKAIKLYLECLDFAKKNQLQLKYSQLLLSLGSLYYQQSRYEVAERYYREGLELAERSGNMMNIANLLNNIALNYQDVGAFDTALIYYDKLFNILSSLNLPIQREKYLGNMGNLYHSWGDFNRALDYYEQAFTLAKKLGLKWDIITWYYSIGKAYIFLNQYQQAQNVLNDALAMAEAYDFKYYMAMIRSEQATLLMIKGEFARAKELLRETTGYFSKVGSPYNHIVQLINTGMLLILNRDFPQAKKVLLKALNSAKQYNLLELKDIVYDNLATMELLNNNYLQAESYFTRSIEIKEQIRKTAKGQTRRNYLDQQFHTYQKLISLYLKMDRPAKALGMREFSSAKYITEELKGFDHKSGNFDIKSFQQSIPLDKAYICYTNVNTMELENRLRLDPDFNGAFIVFYLDRQTVIGYPIKIADYKNQLARLNEFAEKSGYDGSGSPLDQIIAHYRALLTNQVIIRRGFQTTTNKTGVFNQKNLDRYARILYQILLSKIESHFREKKELIILTDGVLGFLPFETLKNKSGTYLVEQFNIRYTFSLMVQELLKQRRYPDTRKPMVAIGGAIYQGKNLKNTPLVLANRRKRNYYRQKAKRLLIKGEGVRSLYNEIGPFAWSDLPGTMREIAAIQKIVPLAVIKSGKDAGEATIKQMAEKGEMKNYKVIHFATHGLTIPEIPSLSALVLSQDEKNTNTEDGYLRTDEIVNMKLNADFVNLSACETGLGTFYRGEGIVGLTQSFLIAGANGLSVSLWQVADNPTMEFMKDVYELVIAEKMSYSKAINETKRRFLKSERYRQPFYWAPFVYYGIE